MATYLNYTEMEALWTIGRNLLAKKDPDFLKVLCVQGRNEDYYKGTLFMKSTAKAHIHSTIDANNTYTFGGRYTSFGRVGAHHVPIDTILEHIEFIDGDYCNRTTRKCYTII